MTEDDRPFVRDFKDLFATLVVSLPLIPHRVRFSKYEHTFTTEEAITNLGSLKFSQSNRMPDPKDPGRIVTTTTTTTFSMAKEMARSVCARFLEARYIESVDGKTDFNSKGSVWQLTPKGMYILGRFCQRNGIQMRHVNDLLESPRNVMHLVILEREAETDKLNHDRTTVEVLFRRFAGQEGPNYKSNVTSSQTDSSSDSLHDYASGLVGVKMVRSRKLMDREIPYTFTGKAAHDWLMDCTTVVDNRECLELATLFIHYDLIIPVVEDRGYPRSATIPHRFQPTKSAVYAISAKGEKSAGWTNSPKTSTEGSESFISKAQNGTLRDSNTNRMTVIIRDPALRLLFREFLRDTHCEENLSFYLDVKDFLATYEMAKRAVTAPKLEIIRETLAQAYSLYNAFLAPGSPCELNIDHSLRNALAGRMTMAIGEDEEMVKSLDEVARLFAQAQNSVFKLMASDSVPKFTREPKYSAVLHERNFDYVLSNFSSTSIG
ncbi:Developmental regulator flbA [Cryomyces minteri]|uniref:Developmental regulator flbA n=1 Tax=Cryomyces minteri TaxID=331657 RepID=A0A4U0X142_9PEZI|nr:Developmental regulator flbA [Cryomyces minteri]